MSQPNNQSSPYTNPYAANNQAQNTNNYSPYSLPNVGNPPPSSQSNYQNPYQPQQGGYPPQGPSRPTYNPQQQPPTYNPQQQPPPYNPQQQPPPYNPQQQQPPYQDPYASDPRQPSTGGNNANSNGPAAANDRIRAIAGQYEINNALAQRLNILQQFEIVVLCDDSGSMNTPVGGTNGTRWDELRSIVQIVIEIGTVFDPNGVDVYFLNRPPMRNVTDARQVVESFSRRPGGFTPLTPTLRQIFQSTASRPSSDKHLLVFVATDGAPTDSNGNIDIQSFENLMRNERKAQTTYVTFLACTDDAESVAYLSQWDRTMPNVDVVDDYKSEREEVRRKNGPNFPFTFGDYVVKALLGAVDSQMDSIDEIGGNDNNPVSSNFRRF